MNAVKKQASPEAKKLWSDTIIRLRSSGWQAIWGSTDKYLIVFLFKRGHKDYVLKPVIRGEQNNCYKIMASNVRDLRECMNVILINLNL